jgi:hypothetical protein
LEAAICAAPTRRHCQISAKFGGLDGNKRWGRHYVRGHQGQFYAAMRFFGRENDGRLGLGAHGGRHGSKL